MLVRLRAVCYYQYEGVVKKLGKKTSELTIYLRGRFLPLSNNRYTLLLLDYPGPHTYCIEVYSLVDSGIVLPLHGKAKHATDDSAVELGPLRITDLLPFTTILYLHIALRHWDPLAVGRQDGSYSHVLHLNIEALWTIQ